VNTQFDFKELIALLQAPDTNLRIVMIEELPGGLGRLYDTYHLDLLDPLPSRFKENLSRTLRGWPPVNEWESYDPAWVPDEGHVARGPRDVAEESHVRQGRLVMRAWPRRTYQPSLTHEKRAPS
jgi:hypothetical protein